mmetsp:Transcript_2421/g.4948  ORF Transcript_2421/g.4948 Transcript_2421/m.4948 type:complete len:555 (-) Transcript_2421:327-1991(-)
MTSVPMVFNQQTIFSLSRPFSSRWAIGQPAAAFIRAQSTKKVPTSQGRVRCSGKAGTSGDRRSSKSKPAQKPTSSIDGLLDRSSRETEEEFSWAARATTRAKRVAQSHGRNPSLKPLKRKLASRSPPALEPWEQPLKAAIVPIEQGIKGPIPAGAAKKLKSNLQRAGTSREVFGLCEEFGINRLSGKQSVHALRRMADIARKNALDQLDRLTVARTYGSEIIKRIVQSLEEDKRSLHTKDLVSTFKSISLLNAVQLYEDEVEVLVEQAAVRVLEGRGPPQVQELLCSLAHARHRPSPSMLAVVEACLERGELAKLNPGGATKLLWSLAVLNLGTPTVIAALDAWTPASDKITSEQLCTCVWSLAVVGATEGALFEALWQELRSRPGLAHLPAAALNQAHQAALSIQLDAPARAAALLTPEADALLAAADASWQAHAQSKKSVSSYQRRISAALTTLGVQHESEALCGGYSVDLVLPLHKVALEADGPSHLLDDLRGPTGPTLMKHRHLRALGWAVLAVPFTEWDMLEGNQQTAYLEERLEELGLGVAPPPRTEG